MSKIINKTFLTGDKIYARIAFERIYLQPGFTYRACGPSTKHRERIQKFRETGNLKQLYRNELDKTCFLMMQHILIVKI